MKTNKIKIAFTPCNAPKNKLRMIYFLNGLKDPIFIKFLNNLKNINFFEYNLWLVGGMLENRLTKDIDLCIEGNNPDNLYEINRNLIKLSLKLNLFLDIQFHYNFKETHEAIKEFLCGNSNGEKFKGYKINEKNKNIYEVKDFLNFLNNKKYKQIMQFPPICLIEKGQFVYNS
jgi:hypothetical protein